MKFTAQRAAIAELITIVRLIITDYNVCRFILCGIVRQATCGYQMVKQCGISFLRRLISTGLMALLPAGAAMAQAQDGFFSELLELVPSGTQMVLGAGPEIGPDYVGSNEYEIEPDIVFFIRLGDAFTVGNDGAALNILGLKGFQFGPVVGTTGGRNETKNPDLAGLGSFGTSLDLGVFAKVNVADYFTARLRYYHAVIGGNNGGLLDLRLSKLLYQKDNLSIVMAVRGSWVQGNRARQFFGISAEQSLSSGLPEFAPGGSFQDLRIDLGGRWEFTDNWSLNGFTRYSRLIGGIADSPIVNPLGSRNQFTVGSYVAYTFSFN